MPILQADDGLSCFKADSSSYTVARRYAVAPMGAYLRQEMECPWPRTMGSGGPSHLPQPHTRMLPDKLPHGPPEVMMRHHPPYNINTRSVFFKPEP